MGEPSTLDYCQIAFINASGSFDDSLGHIRWLLQWPFCTCLSSNYPLCRCTLKNPSPFFPWSHSVRNWTGAFKVNIMDAGFLILMLQGASPEGRFNVIEWMSNLNGSWYTSQSCYHCYPSILISLFLSSMQFLFCHVFLAGMKLEAIMIQDHAQ